MDFLQGLRKNRDTLYSFGATVARAATRFLLVFLASFLLTRTEFGIFNIFLSIYFFARLFSENSLNLPFIKFASDGEYPPRSVNFQVLVLKFIYVGLVSALVLAISGPLVDWSGLERRDLLFLLPPMLLALTMYMFVGQALTARVRMGMLFGYELFTCAVFCAVLAAVWTAGTEFTTEVLVRSFTLALAVAAAIGGICFRRLIPIRIRPDRELLWKIVHYSKFTVLSGISSLVILKADVLMLGFFRGAEEVGVYGMALFVNEAVQMVFDSVLRVCLPRASALSGAGKTGEIRQLFAASVKNIYLGILPVVAFLAVAAPEVIHRVYQGRYDDSIFLIYLFLASALLKPVGYVAGILLGATGNIRLDNRNCWIAAVLNLLCNLLLIPPYGVTGAATASAASFLCLTVLHYLSVRKAVFG